MSTTVIASRHGAGLCLAPWLGGSVDTSRSLWQELAQARRAARELQ